MREESQQVWAHSLKANTLTTPTLPVFLSVICSFFIFITSMCRWLMRLFLLLPWKLILYSFSATQEVHIWAWKLNRITVRNLNKVALSWAVELSGYASFTWEIVTKSFFFFLGASWLTRNSHIVLIELGNCSHSLCPWLLRSPWAGHSMAGFSGMAVRGECANSLRKSST